MKTLDIKLLRTMVAFADSGSCKGAADIVGRTHSAVSIHLKRLEETTGKKLFTPNGRGLTLTSDGHYLTSYARRILNLHNEALTAFDTDRFSGTLRVGLPDDYIPMLLDTLLSAFSSIFPRAQIDLTCAPSAALRPMLGDGDLDMAILSCETGSHDGFVLKRESTYWIAAPGFKCELNDTVKLLLFPEGCILRKWALNALKKTKRNSEIACTSQNMQALKSAMAHGMGVMVATRSNVPDNTVVLTEAEGFPNLPDVTIILSASPHTDRGIVETLHGEISKQMRWAS